ncbi:MAG: alpha-amylase [Flavobacteriales bacterium]|nr:alpha-amylase [Flavobacteriales bacterium]
MRILITTLTLCLFHMISFGQILQVTPTFPTVEDEVTIVYNAQEGNAELAGLSPIYAHMGLITSESTSGTDWQFVQGNWGTDDPQVLMTDLGDDLHSITVDMDEFYGFPDGTEVLQMAFVFRNEDGTLVGREADGSDIFYDVYPVGTSLVATILSPTDNIIIDLGETLQITGESSGEANLTLKIDGSIVANQIGSMIEYEQSISVGGTHEVVFEAVNGPVSSSDTVFYTVPGDVVTQNPPAGMLDGVNYLSSSSMLLQFHAPEKDYVYVIGDFNDWIADEDYFMLQADDGETWWLQIDGLTPGQRVAYQYWVDGEIKVADPCSPLILDPNNDNWIPSMNYPDPHPYPFQQTSGFCTVAHPGADEYLWQDAGYQRPERKDLRIYELLVRDFVETQSYLTLIDTLDYLENLGINAIELMPPGEFENNNSWGYNPSFHMALDKMYGTPEHFKQFVDECHQRGIAVIVDMVLNHAFGQSPLVNLYWDGGAPAANSPWFNVECPHEPYCWGYDFDHTSVATQRYVDRVNRHWIEEYHVDGYRFDFTGGFTNGTSGGYSTQRIGLVQRMADFVWSVDPDSYIILEHWCDNSEEEILSDYGCMLWGNVTYNYQEAAMGYLPGSNFEWGIHSQRGWSDPHLVTYAESHDEERVSFKTLSFGNSEGDYDTQEMLVAMARNELNAVFLLSQPGPKMIWQFGELGYDISIDFDCRVCPKPILWNYFEQNHRRKVYDVYSAMNHLREEYPNTFNSTDIAYNLNGAFKRINLYNSDMDAVVIGNFGVEPISGSPNFPFMGTWYDYFSGESIVENNPDNEFLLQPGEYRIYTSQPLEQPDITVSVPELQAVDLGVELFPTLMTDQVTLTMDIGDELAEVDVWVYDMQAKVVKRPINGKSLNGEQVLTFDLDGSASGMYQVLVSIDDRVQVLELIKQ